MSASLDELKQIASDINVIRDGSESEIAWLRRVIYSICGRMMLASLWDDRSDTGLVSIRHVKQRGMDILNAYQLAYPEIISENNFGVCNNDIVERIYNLFLETGQVYHKRNYVRPSTYKSLSAFGISFLSGMYATDDYYLSGVGPYSYNTIDYANERLSFSHPSMKKMLSGFVKKASWYRFADDTENYEFLRTIPPFTRGYWRGDIDRTDDVTLLRYKSNGGLKQYYLCKYHNSELMISDLPMWLNAGRNHVLLSIALLKEYGVLPSACMTRKNTLTLVEVPYRMPPEEENLLNAYSWPVVFDGEDRSFKRVIAEPLHDAIKELLINVGFDVEER